MKNKNKTIHVKPGPSERRLKICAVVISLLFAALMLYPLIFAISSSMKDNAKIYEIPPQLLPDSANSLSVVIDYSGMEFSDEAQMKDGQYSGNARHQLQNGRPVHHGNQGVRDKRRQNDFLFQGAPDEASNGTGLRDLFQHHH